MNQKPLCIGVKVGVGGRFRFRTGINDGYIDANSGLWMPGKDIVTKEIPWFDNIITNQGLDYIGGTATWLNYLHVGTGTTTEAATDTVLGTFVASQAVDDNVAVTFRSTRGSPPYYAYARRHFRIPPGTATANLSEAAISNQATTGNLFSRALIKDSGGSPTTINKLANEYLDCDYDWRVYPAYVSGDLDSVVSGEDFVLRAANVTTHGNFGTHIYQKAGHAISGSTRLISYNKDAVLGSVTQPPQSSTDNDPIGTAASDAAYTPGNHYVDITYNIGLDDAVFNVGGSDGIRALLFYTTMGAYQLRFDDLQAKTAEDIAALVVRLSWARATIP